MNYFVIADLCGMFFTMFEISYHDTKTHLISDSNILALTGYVWFYKYLSETVFDFMNGAIVALVINYVVFYLVRWFYGSEEYGLGDVFLHGCVGGFFGPNGYLNYWLFSTTMIGFILLLLLVFRLISRNTVVPMAPAIFVTAICFYWTGQPNFLKMIGL